MKPAVIALVSLVFLTLVILYINTLNNQKKTEHTDGFEGGSGGSFTLYYADWCPHCQTIKPVFKDFMGSGKVNVNGKSIDCKMVEEKELKKNGGPDIKGYPTLIYSDASGKNVEFSGPRTPDGFMEFLTQQI
jgi:thiol-disulfide isomerase/thioredoxin